MKLLKRGSGKTRNSTTCHWFIATRRDGLHKSPQTYRVTTVNGIVKDISVKQFVDRPLDHFLSWLRKKGVQVVAKMLDTVS